MGMGRRKTENWIRTASKQENLVKIACVILAVLTIHALGSPQPSKNNISLVGPDLSGESRPASTHKPKPPKRPPVSTPLLMSWHGPVQPVSLPPNVAPVFYKVPTTDPVVFVGIDDGVWKNPETLKWLSEHHLPFSMFLYNGVINNNYGYFAKLQAAGMDVQNHTLSHPLMSKLNLDQQKAEICGAADTYGLIFGRRPTLFRPPYGDYNDITRQAAAECGMRAIVMWHATIEGGTVHFQDNLTSLQPGDIILMHFRPELLQDIQTLSRQLQKDRLQIGRLEDWIK
jgi:peptidoglycan/xylan/chitin deacetylase (PgdA/CDA1 family)